MKVIWGNPKFPRKLKHENKSPLLLTRIDLSCLLVITDQLSWVSLILDLKVGRVDNIGCFRPSLKIAETYGKCLVKERYA